jgi:hypothetical protein
MKINLHVLSKEYQGTLVLTDKAYKKYKDRLGLYEKDSILYDMAGWTIYYVTHIEIDTEEQ